MKKIVIIGIGAVGAATAYTLASQGICNELVLIDANHDKAVSESLDICHALPLIGDMDVCAGGYEDCANADVIIIAAGWPRIPSGTRLDLAAGNSAICKQIVSNLKPFYTGGVILVATNPVDVLTVLITEEMGLPAGRVIGSGTVLDGARLRYVLSRQLGIDAGDVHGYVLGEHGDSMLIAWSLSHISGMNVERYFELAGHKLDESEKNAIYKQVQKGSSGVLKGKGHTSFAIAASLAAISRAICENSSSIYTVSTVLDGAYGIRGAAVSVPSVVGKDGVSGVIEYPLAKAELEALQGSAIQIQATLKVASENPC